MQKTGISLVIITLNEEKNIERCIRSVPFAQDVFVLDSGSTDRTVELASRMGARVRVEPFRGYAKQKKRATAMALNNWVLSLDGDEALSPELAAEIEKLAEGTLDRDGYYMPRLSYFLGRWIKHGGWYPDKQLRLFNKEKADWGGGNVHEKVIAENVGQLKNPIHHWVFENLSAQITTNNSFSTLGAQDHVEKGKGFSFLKLIIKPPIKFIECYVFKMGFLDGLAGLIIASNAAHSMFLKMAKVWEMKKLSQGS